MVLMASQYLDLNLVKLWEQLDTRENTGHNQLVKQAICILSIVGNSARCERLFSEMGLIHTRVQNCHDLFYLTDTLTIAILNI
jgi:hypothetical protein